MINHQEDKETRWNMELLSSFFKENQSILCKYAQSHVINNQYNRFKKLVIKNIWDSAIFFWSQWSLLKVQLTLSS